MPIQTREETGIGVMWPPGVDFPSRPLPGGLRAHLSFLIVSGSL
jgi:hypothetical protein